MHMRLAMALWFLFLSSSIFAAEEVAEVSGEWSGIFGTQLTFGGDTLVALDVEDIFGDVEESKVKAGEIFGVFVGGAYRFASAPIQLQATAGLHYAGVFAENGDASFRRLPVELILFANAGAHRIGAGVTHHINPEFETDLDFGADIETDFDDSSGFVLQYDYVINNRYGIGIRYVNIEYEPKVPAFFRPIKVDGSHGGIIFTYMW